MSWYTVKISGTSAGLHHTRDDCPLITRHDTADPTYSANTPTKNPRFCTVCSNRDAREAAS